MHCLLIDIGSFFKGAEKDGGPDQLLLIAPSHKGTYSNLILASVGGQIVHEKPMPHR